MVEDKNKISKMQPEYNTNKKRIKGILSGYLLLILFQLFVIHALLYASPLQGNAGPNSLAEHINVQQLTFHFSSVDSFMFIAEGQMNDGQNLVFILKKQPDHQFEQIIHLKNKDHSISVGSGSIDVFLNIAFDTLALNQPFSPSEKLSFIPLQIEGELHITGTWDQPAAEGTLHSCYGLLGYSYQNFTLQSARFDFIESSVEPVLEISGIYEASVVEDSAGVFVTRSYTVFLTTNGPFQTPDLKLTAKPFLNENDVNSLLTIGRTSKSPLDNFSFEGEGLKGLINSVPLDRIKNYTESQIQGFLGLDKFQVEDDIFKSKGKSFFVANKQFQNLKITFSSGVGKHFKQEIKLDYPIYKNIFLESTTDQQGNASADIQWVFDFK